MTLSHSHSISLFTPSFLVPKLPIPNSKIPLHTLRCTSPKFEEDSILQLVANSDGSTASTTLPCVRTFENDLSRLSLVGSVGFDQALTAAAADGGQAANEHVNSGLDAMVVETVFPGPGDVHATVSTRLFLPAKKVKEKAARLKRTFKEDIFHETTSQNILAMTFRQVVLQQLWNFELTMFTPGTERNMENLESPREQVPSSFILSSSDEHVISVLAEAICCAALQNTERNFLDGSVGNSALGGVFCWFQKPRRIESRDSSVVIYRLFEHEILENAKSLLENFISSKESLKEKRTRQKHNWWTPAMHSKLERIGGPDFSFWASEYVPAYMIEIDGDKVKDVKFQGWRRSVDNRWEFLLTHSQMVGLAEVLDMYYEDTYSLPHKELSCNAAANLTNFTGTKKSFSLLKILSVTLASGIFLITISALSRFCFPQLHKGEPYSHKHRSPLSSQLECSVNESVDSEKLQELCISIIKKIRDAFGWSGDIVTETSNGAWIGEIPNYLKAMGESDFRKEDVTTSALEKIDEDMKLSAQDLASYQVVMSTDGRIVGFQPTSRVGVNHWADNPLARELYGGRKLSPGPIETGLKIPLPNEVVAIELLMSVNVDSCFALARPVR